MERNAVVKIAGAEYEIDPSSYREWVEADVIGARRFNEIVGTSRPALEPRAEIRTWRMDDWVNGEGSEFLTSEPTHPSLRGYYQSSDAIDISKPGKVSLGFATKETIASGSLSSVYLTSSGGKVFAFDATFTRGAQYQDPVDTWNDIGGAVDVNGSTGPVSGHASGVFSANEADVFRTTTAGGTNWNTENGSAALVADNRVYYVVRGSTSSTLARVGLDAAAAGTTVATYNGVGSTYAGRPVQSVAVGSRIYTLHAFDGESARLWVLEGDVAREVCVFDGLRCNQADPAVQQMAVVNGIVFVGGWEVSPTGNEMARLDYFDGRSPDTALRFEHREESTASSGNSRFSTLVAGRQDELVLGVRMGDGLTSRLFRYDLRTQGISHFVTGTAFSLSVRVASVVLLNGVYYFSHADNSYAVRRTIVSGSGKYVAAATIIEPIWDFDLPDTEKLATEFELHVEGMAAGTSIEVQLVLDATTTVTTDASGATMSLTAAESVTRKRFTLSDDDTERTFRFVQPKLVLKTSNTANTPILYSATLRCMPLATRLRYFEFDVLCRDESATNRLTAHQRTGDDIAADLIALRDSTSDRVFQFVPLIKDSPSPHPGPTETTHNVAFAPGQENGIYRSIAAGEGVMRLRLLKIGA